MRISRLTTNIYPKFRGDNSKEAVQREFYPNGGVRLIKERDGALEYHYESGGRHYRIEPDRTERGWYMTGSQSYIKHPDGVIETFYQSGKLKSISRPDRTFQNWDENGFLRFEKLKDGTTITYPSRNEKIITHPDGRVETISIDEV